MRVLVIKTSSLGDVIHALPALTDAARAVKNIEFDWVVEERIKAIPQWHPNVKRVIPVAIRRWRKSLYKPSAWKEIFAFIKKLREEQYDLIIDAQGLIKTGWINWFARGESAGLDYQSARESFTSFFYQRKLAVEFKQHAVVRYRELFSRALFYPLPEGNPDYGVSVPCDNSESHYVLFFHGTTWTTKHWPEAYWKQLAKLSGDAGYKIKVAWGSALEKERAQRIADTCENAEICDDLGLDELAKIISQSKAVVTVDTGLGHLAAAFDKPTVALFGPTEPKYTGLCGKNAINLSATFPCAPCLRRECTYKGQSHEKPACFETLPPNMVWEKLLSMIE
ncbi:MAG: lipopolysaccharide heptosyltransferase I [Gammaproteobacteria bacterium]